MDHSPSPSASPSDSDRSGRVSQASTPVSGTPSHSQIGQPDRESQPPPNLDGSKDTASNFTPSGRGRSSIDDNRENGINEQSPLLAPRASEDVEGVPSISSALSPERSDSDTWNDEDGTQEQSKSSWYMLILTMSFLGLQIGWSVEMSNGSPYLLSLGITKSLLAFVWIAGPLSGTLVQPYVGIKSDRCRSRFGKRRPFMVGGGLATVVSLLMLAWMREIVGGFLSIFGVARDSKGTQTTAIVLAVIMVYILDFSINVLQAGIRAFVVDSAPTHQQDTANAWASRLMGIGNIIGYIFGYADLPKYLWFFGDTQFKVLCAIASLGLASTLAVSCSISEQDPRLEGEPAKEDGGIVALFKSLWRSVRLLPFQIKAVCYVQLAAWVGWFPFLFYITTYIGQLYVDPIFRANPNMTDQEIDETWEHGTRIGTFALLIYALVSFAASVALPWVITSSYKSPEPLPRTPMRESPRASRTLAPLSSDHGDGYFDLRHTATTNSAGATDFTDGYYLKSAKQSSWFKRLKGRLPDIEIPWLTLRRAWMISHLLFFAFTWLTLVATNTTTATILTGLIGIPWAVTMWAPFALIAAEVSKRDKIRRGLIRAPPTVDGERLARGEDESDGADQAGVVLGIHNVAIAAPQVVATLVSSAIFQALQKPRGTVGDDSVAWVLRFGGLFALAAAWMTRWVREEGDEEGDRKAKW